MPKTPATTIKAWLETANGRLKSVGIDSFHLDAELILCNALKKDRTYLHANSEQNISSDICELANKWLKDRESRIPLAYIFGTKEFYGRDFIVNTNVLIPRPESEDVINLLLELAKPNYKSLVDIGTGSGCLGITAKLELPNLSVLLLDISQAALEVARKNSIILSADVSIIKSDLMSGLDQCFDIIVANLPYVDTSWQRSPETTHEPALALFSNDNGLAITKKLISQATQRTTDNGLLIIENDTTQHEDVIEYANNLGFRLLKKQGYILAFSKN